MTRRPALALVVLATVAACGNDAPQAVEPIGRPDAVLVSGRDDAVYATDANRGTSIRLDPSDSRRWRPAVDALQRERAEDQSPAPPADVRRFVPPGSEATGWSQSPDGRRMAVATIPDAGGSGRPAEFVTTVTTYDIGTGDELGRHVLRTATATTQLEWSRTSAWLFVSQDDAHVVAYRPEQDDRSLRQINVPDAETFAVAPDGLL